MSSRSRPGLPAGDEEFDPRAVAVRDAATVMLVRDGRDGLEVFMLQRTLKAVFASGKRFGQSGSCIWMSRMCDRRFSGQPQRQSPHDQS